MALKLVVRPYFA